MAAPSKTQATSLIAIATWATATTIVSSVIDVSTKFAGTVYVHFGRTIATALTNNLTFRIEASAKSTLDGQWYPLYTWQTLNGKVAAQTTSATAGSAGQKVITVTNTGFTVGDLLYCNNATIGNAEFCRDVTHTSTTAINVEDNLVNAQTTSPITNKAEWWAIPLDLSGVGRLRLVADGSAVAGVTTVVEAFLTTMDSVA